MTAKDFLASLIIFIFFLGGVYLFVRFCIRMLLTYFKDKLIKKGWRDDGSD